MASFFSDHFSADGSNKSTVDIQKRASAGISHGRLRYKRASIDTVDTANADEVRFCQFKSSDRIIEVFVTGDGTPSAGTMDIGLYKSGTAHDGAVIDDDLFASALAIDSASARVDEFTEATTLGNLDRGKTLWELATVGAASYTSDPMEDWDLVGTTDTGTTGNLAMTVEVIYTSGD